MNRNYLNIFIGMTHKGKASCISFHHQSQKEKQLQMVNVMTCHHFSRTSLISVQVVDKECIPPTNDDINIMTNANNGCCCYCFDVIVEGFRDSLRCLLLNELNQTFLVTMMHPQSCCSHLYDLFIISIIQYVLIVSSWIFVAFCLWQNYLFVFVIDVSRLELVVWFHFQFYFVIEEDKCQYVFNLGWAIA